MTMFDAMIHRTLEGTGDSDALVSSIFGITCTMQPNLVLELGVREGISTLPLLWGTYLSKGMLVSVDLHPTPFQPPEEMADHWQFVQGESIEFLERVGDENPDIIFDVVFVDDWHSYQHVKRELELLDRYTTKDSIILLHDCMVGTMRGNAEYQQDRPTPEDNPEFAEGGPARAVRELDATRWEWATIPISNGLTLLRKLV